MSRTHHQRDEVFAVIRLDLFQHEPESQVTVKEIVWERHVAEAEVARLNALNAAKQCRYFWQSTRLAPPQLSVAGARGPTSRPAI